MPYTPLPSPPWEWKIFPSAMKHFAAGEINWADNNIYTTQIMIQYLKKKWIYRGTQEYLIDIEQDFRHDPVDDPDDLLGEHWTVTKANIDFGDVTTSLKNITSRSVVFDSTTGDTILKGNRAGLVRSDAALPEAITWTDSIGYAAIYKANIGSGSEFEETSPLIAWIDLAYTNPRYNSGASATGFNKPYGTISDLLFFHTDQIWFRIPGEVT
jgi:hypothetical protein